MQQLINYNKSSVLLTEGKNDCCVIAALCEFHKLPDFCTLDGCGSDEKALKKLSALIAIFDSDQRKDVIGIVLDADNPNMQSKWASVRDRLLKFGYDVPEAPLPNGTIIEMDNKPKVGVWLMPNNIADGMLEDFCSSLISAEALDFAKTCIEKAKDQGYTTFKNVHTSKSVVHTFLAWQNEPGMPLGQSIKAKALDAEKPTAIIFVEFLKRLFT